MSTTGAVAEILVAGLLALFWLFGVLSLVDRSETDKAVLFLSSPAGGVLVLALSYQIGWIVNSVTYMIAKLVYFKQLLCQVEFTRETYESLKVEIYSNKAYEHLIRLLEQETVVHRIARAGGLNFFMLACVGILKSKWRGSLEGEHLISLVPSVILLLLAAYSWRLAYNRHLRYFRLMESARKVLNLQRPQELAKEDVK